MDEIYLDGGDDAAVEGLINDPSFVISKEAIAAHNERDGEENISSGWHAIEFLLWGTDTSPDGPGNRPPSDYLPGQGRDAERRGLYLKTVTALLVDDLSGLERQWAANQPGNYRTAFRAGGADSIRRMFVGLGSLSSDELARERLEVALSSQDQEDEQSCFSDNTHRDAITNALGIRNVWLGQAE